MHYFAADGNYGDAQDAVVVDTTDWTEDDWQEVDESGDMSRMDVVKSIIDRRISEWGNVAHLID